MKTDERPARIIRASEIGQYAYCARAWWLGSVKGAPSTNTREMARGEEVHQQHGRSVWLAGALRVLALLLALAAVALLILAFVRP
jgi:CRISPR/Cas system-associated exonuclease Cas4 (RecB family)